MNDPKRRDFLKASMASLATAAVGTSVLAEQQDSPAVRRHPGSLQR
jgi:hypothetical protein